MFAIPISAVLSSCNWKPTHALTEASFWQLKMHKRVWGNLAARTCQFKLYTITICAGCSLFASSRFPVNAPDITPHLVSCLHLCFTSTKQTHFAWVPRLLSFKTPRSQFAALNKKNALMMCMYSHDCVCTPLRLDEAEHSSIIKKLSEWIGFDWRRLKQHGHVWEKLLSKGLESGNCG